MIVLATRLPFLLLCVLLADPLVAQTLVNGGGAGEPVALHALQLIGGPGIDVDGRLDEEVWQQAIPITDFT